MIAKIVGNQGSYRAINTDVEISGPGQDIVIVKEPEDSGDRIWVLDAIQLSYKSVDPIEGKLTVKVGDNNKLALDIDCSLVHINTYIPGQTDKSIEVRLTSGGLGVIGKLNCQWHLEPAE